MQKLSERQQAPEGGLKRKGDYLFKGIYLATAATFLLYLVRAGLPPITPMIAAVTFAVLALIISPVAMKVIRVRKEDNQPKGMFSLKTQSWTFVLGDTLAVPALLGFAVFGWIRLGEGWHYSIWWFFFSVGLGVAASFGFREFDRSRYKDNDYGRFFSHTKLWHDFPAYTTLVSLSICAGLPVATDWWDTLIASGHWQPAEGLWVTVAFVVWLLLGLFDTLVTKPDPPNQHPDYRPDQPK